MRALIIALTLLGAGLSATAAPASRPVDEAGPRAIQPPAISAGTAEVAPLIVRVGTRPATLPADRRAPPARIVYLIDGSGSMLSWMDLVGRELRRSIGGLKPTQSFNVIFFRDGGVAAADADELLPATEGNKRRASEFLDKFSPYGSPDPTAAIDAAAKLKPDVVFLMTNGDFVGPGNDAVVAHCKRLFSNGRTKIHTMALLTKESKDDPQDLAFVKALQEIARNSGGNFRYVSEEDLGK